MPIELVWLGSLLVATAGGLIFCSFSGRSPLNHRTFGNLGQRVPAVRTGGDVRTRLNTPCTANCHGIGRIAEGW
jgi:hypothetical protein